MSASASKPWPALVSGLLLSAAFPPWGVPEVAWVALVPLFIGLRQAGPSAAFKNGMLAGLAHYLTLLYWVVITMRTYGFLPWWQAISLLVLLAAYLALYPGLFAWGVCYGCRKPAHLILLAPILWVALEYLRSFMLTGFPWGLLGYSQYNRLPLLQMSDLFGVYGVSFLVVLSNACLYVWLLGAAGKPWGAAVVVGPVKRVAVVLPLVLIGLGLGYGYWRIAAVERAVAQAPAARVAVVQGNIDQALKWDPALQAATTQKYVDLTLNRAAPGADLVVWPETATPFYFDANPDLTARVADAARRSQTPLLVGSPRMEKAGEGFAYYNSAYLVAADGRIAGHYDKVHLVPFGEYVPLKNLLSFVGKMVAQVGDFSSGEKGRTLDWRADTPPVGVQICFESIFPELSRSLVINGAGLLVNLTNDAWFGRSSAAYQHFSMAVFRAVETRRALVRCANTGISAFIDPVGRIAGQTALFEEVVAVGTVAMLGGVTLYTRIGDGLPQACLIFWALLVPWRIHRDRRRGYRAGLGRSGRLDKSWSNRRVDRRR